ncbi:LuxR C-terminal-related transcriptional regulator [Clostridium sp. BNL1100]|uniref:helix-turn-helix transcriptional regulator n=1 Tax=Clostridium sp. BNL1100 TaxID=755731 RepID=UPI00024A729A|nr:LuxR C-terminal-related transcriptional regulator [Clostridium sp. BNL1100]AEY66339.1 response regulator containing a CheY-like receiver domain and an HTH DNA-binding domain [Clostridium sp. BNL1100]
MSFFILSDVNKVALKLFGRKKLLSYAQESLIQTGTNFDELISGTNSIDLAMRLNSSSYMLPESNYCDFLRNWYMFSVPIKTKNENQGCISILSRENCISQEIALIVRLLAYKISNEYKKRKINNTDFCDVKLTNSQLRILKVLARGYTDKCAAMELGISLGTVRYHKTNIFRKLNVESCVQAIMKVLKYGIISLDDMEL